MGAPVLRPSNAVPTVQQTDTDERPSLDLYAFEGNGRSARSLSLKTTPEAAIVDMLADTLPVDCDDGGDVDPLAVDGAPDDAVPTPPPEVDPGMLFVNSLRLPLSEALVRTPVLPWRAP
jgi:hypothetical protein